MRITTTILGAIAIITGIVAIFQGMGYSINGRFILIITLLILAAVIILGIVFPNRKEQELSDTAALAPQTNEI